MIDFGFDPTTAVASQQIVRVVPEVEQQVTVTALPSRAASYVMKPEQAWGWDDLRDYVIREIESRHGPQVRDPRKEAGIFKAFLSRWPDQGPAIARVAFEVHDGMWRNAPISVNRFCQASDAYFATVIAARL